MNLQIWILAMFYGGTDLDPKVLKAIEQADDALGRVRSLISELQFLPLIYKMLLNRLESIKQN